MASKQTMTLNLSEGEMEKLVELCKKKGISKTALVRQALRLYQTIDARTEEGEKLFLEDPSKKEKSELMVL